MQLKEGAQLQQGKYQIIRVLGQGGFGITYLAENLLLGRKVAIKEFFPKDFCGRDNTCHLTLGTENNRETVSKLKDRFLKEARNIARLDHPGIIRIHDVFEENNTAYYVMDYIEGENLNEMVKRNGPLSEVKAIEYIIKVGEALEYIHSKNMTHFDVKPANIVVRKSDDMPILIDFGLSKQYDAQGEATSTLLQAVSHGYSAIELYNSGAIQEFSPQTDVYSLGATLYYLVTGNVPPHASSLIEEGLTFPSSISESIKSVIEAAMQMNRGRRLKSISDFITKLKNQQYTNVKHVSESFVGNNSENENTQLIEAHDNKKNTYVNEQRNDDTLENINDYYRHLDEKRKRTRNISFFILGMIIVGSILLALLNKSYDNQTVDIQGQEVDTSNDMMDYANESKDSDDIITEEWPKLNVEEPVNKKDKPNDENKTNRINGGKEKSTQSSKNKHINNNSATLNTTDATRDIIISTVDPSEKIYTLAMVDEKPEFPGGERAMYEWLSEHIIYPKRALDEGIFGRVVVQFDISKTGIIENIKVVRSRHPSLDDEAVRLISSMPKWKPGKHNGSYVTVTYTLPITFKLSD